jgi:hypothetical protein
MSKNKKTSFILELIKNCDESIIDKVVEVLKKISKTSLKWKPEQNEKYFYISLFGVVGCDVWCNDISDNWLYNQRICFKTKKEAEEYKKFLEIKAKIMDIAEELGRPTMEDWENGNKIKYCLEYAFDVKEIEQAQSHRWKEKNIYCLSEDFLKVCLEKIGEEDLKFYLISDFI